MPFFSSFTGSFSVGRRKPISIGGGGGGGGGAPGVIDFSSMSVTYQFDNPNDPLYKGQDRFSNTVAIDGTTAVIGAYEAEDAGGNNSGFVAVYDLTDGSRTYSVANPNPFGTSLNDQFGYSVDISGDNFIVGAYQEDTDLVSGLASGKAYIFRTSDGALLHTLDNPNLSGTDTDNFGASVAIYGNYAVVGAPNEQEVGGTLYNAGAIHVYNVTTGALLFSRANPNTGADNPQDAFGRGLDINDQYIVVGATNEDTPASNSGVIHVYDLTGTLLRTIQNPNDYGTAENDGFGGFNRVSISGDKLLAGVNGEDGPAGDAVGVAYVFDLTDGSLLQTLRNPTPVAFDTFAQYVDLDGNYALIGAPGVDNPGGDTNGGAAFIFDITDGSLQSTIINPNVFASTSDGFGTGVAIAGEYVIVGSLEDEAGASNAGKAYVYQGVASSGGGGGAADFSLLSTPDFTLTPPVPSAFLEYGWSTGISENYAIVGVWIQEVSGVPQAGTAYIYDPTDGSLLFTLDNPEVVTSRYGFSVDISDTAAIIGSYQHPGTGSGIAGKAFLFDPTDGSLIATITNPYTNGTSRQFGYSVAASDTYVLVSSYRNGDTGRAHLYNASNGSLLHSFTASDQHYGYDVDVSDTYSIVGSGAFLTFVEDGKAYVYNNSTGSLVYTFTNPNAYGAVGDQFGASVGISASYAIVGAPYEDDAVGSNRGKAYVYDLSDGSLLYTLDNPADNITQALGKTVEINESYAFVGNGNTKILIFDLSDGSLVNTIEDTGSYMDASDTRLIGGDPAQIVDGFNYAGSAYIYNAS